MEGRATDHQRRIAFGIMQYLQRQVASGKLLEDGIESLGVAIQCIGEVYQVDLDNPNHVAAYGSDKSLEELYPAAAAKEPSPSEQGQAEAFKTQGNAHLKNGKMEEAVECYSKAIEIDPSNATYFCNRAAALIKQQKLQQALEDCLEATRLNPSYARAHGRLGYVYSSLGQYSKAKKCFDEAIRLDPDNKSYQENLATVEQQLKTGQQQQPPPGAAPGAAAGAAAGGGGGGGGGGGRGGQGGAAGGGGIPGLGSIGNIMNNPAFVNMASSIMSQPGFQQLASRMMGNMAGGGAGEGVMPQVVQMAQDMQQNNPELFQNLQEQAQRLSEQQPSQQNPSQQ